MAAACRMGFVFCGVLVHTAGGRFPQGGSGEMGVFRSAYIRCVERVFMARAQVVVGLSCMTAIGKELRVWLHCTVVWCFGLDETGRPANVPSNTYT